VRLRWLALLLLLPACAWSAQPRPADAAGPLKTAQAVEPVRIETPVRFWRAGKWIESRDAVVLRVEVANRADFEPRDAPDPLFVYGRAVCEVLVHPFFAGGHAVLLAPPLEGDDPPALRVIPWVPLERTKAQTFDRVLARVKSITIAPPPASSERRAYPTLEHLRVEVAPKRREQPR
jgi:hypothetical protein